MPHLLLCILLLYETFKPPFVSYLSGHKISSNKYAVA